MSNLICVKIYIFTENAQEMSWKHLISNWIMRF